MAVERQPLRRRLVWRRAAQFRGGGLRFISIYVDFTDMARERRPSNQTASLLAAFLEQPRAWRHGYDLSIETQLKSGTLYPVLMRLSDRGFLDSKWEPAESPGRPPRHMYRLTSKGAAFAKEQLSASNRKPGLTRVVGSRA
jgi:PadR family transcriptional regulator